MGNLKVNNLMNEVTGMDCVSLNTSVAEGKQKGEAKRSLPLSLAAIRKECGDSRKSFAKTWMEAQKV